jgi:hypothetical protein
MFLETLSSHLPLEEVSELVKDTSQKFYDDRGLSAVVEQDRVIAKEIKNAHRVPKLYNQFPPHKNVRSMIAKLYQQSPGALLDFSDRIMSRLVTYRRYQGDIIRDFTVYSYDVSSINQMLNKVPINGDPRTFLINAWPEPPNPIKRTPESLALDNIRENLWTDYVNFMRGSLIRFQQKH